MHITLIDEYYERVRIRGVLSVERTTTPFQTEIFSWNAVPGREKRRSGTLKKEKSKIRKKKKTKILLI